MRKVCVGLHHCKLMSEFITERQSIVSDYTAVVFALSTFKLSRCDVVLPPSHVKNYFRKINVKECRSPAAMKLFLSNQTKLILSEVICYFGIIDAKSKSSTNYI